METEIDMENYLRVKLLDIEENAYRIGFIDGKKQASSVILETITPIVTKDCLKEITRMVRKIDIKDPKFEEEVLI